MGYYIPNNIPLEERGATPTSFLNFDDIPEDKALICEVDNYHFKANALIYSNRELEEFSNPSDRRQKRWYLMDKKEAHQLSGYK